MHLRAFVNEIFFPSNEYNSNSISNTVHISCPSNTMMHWLFTRKTIQEALWIHSCGSSVTLFTRVAAQDWKLRSIFSPTCSSNLLELLLKRTKSTTHRMFPARFQACTHQLTTKREHLGKSTFIFPQLQLAGCVCVPCTILGMRKTRKHTTIVRSP